MLDSSSSPETSASRPAEQTLVAAHANFTDFITSPKLLAAIGRLGYTRPTPIQERTIPLAILGRDVIAQAQTGSGKTLAYVLPILQRLEANPSERHTAAIALAPTRELATQIVEVIEAVGGFKVPCLIGGSSMHDQRNALDNDHRIVVGTPGRLNDFIRQREVLLNKCAYCVLDEADEMLSMDFLQDVETILARLPDTRQTMFISATISPRVESLGNRFLKNPERIVVETPKDTLPPIEHLYYELDGGVASKAAALCDLLEVRVPRAALIFCNTKSDTELVEVFLRRRGFDARRINSDLNQRQRDAVMKRIKSGDLRFLVGTDIAARGLDIAELDLVVNYTLPGDPETYVHRTGRTGRAGRSGVALSLVGPGDFAAFQDLRKTTAVNLKKTPLPDEAEVLAARVKHFSELLGTARINVQARDEAVALQLFQSAAAGGEATLAKLYRFALEHMLNLQTQSLDEELGAEGRSAGSDDRSAPQRNYNRENDRYNGGGGGSRGGGGGDYGGRDRRGGGGGGRRR